MIYRGTTPTIRFKLDTDASKISDISIFFSQGGNVIYTKELPDVNIEYEINTLSVVLSRDETMILEPNKDLHIQLVLEFNDGKVSSSRYLTEYVHDTMDNQGL